MINTLLARAQLALEENAIVRHERIRLRDEQQIARDDLRRSVLKSMMQRTELKAVFEDSSKPASAVVGPDGHSRPPQNDSKR